MDSQNYENWLGHHASDFHEYSILVIDILDPANAHSLIIHKEHSYLCHNNVGRCSIDLLCNLCAFLQNLQLWCPWALLHFEGSCALSHCPCASFPICDGCRQSAHMLISYCSWGCMVCVQLLALSLRLRGLIADSQKIPNFRYLHMHSLSLPFSFWACALDCYCCHRRHCCCCSYCLFYLSNCGTLLWTSLQRKSESSKIIRTSFRNKRNKNINLNTNISSTVFPILYFLLSYKIKFSCKHIL